MAVEKWFPLNFGRIKRYFLNSLLLGLMQCPLGCNTSGLTYFSVRSVGLVSRARGAHEAAMR